MDAATLELVKAIGGGVGVGAFAVFVALQLRDQTRLLASINRKHARTEVLTIAVYEALTGKRVQRFPTAPLGVPTRPTRSKADSDDPGIAVSRTTTDEDVS